MHRNSTSFRTTLDELILHFEQVNNADLTVACNYCCDQAAAAAPGSDARALWLELGSIVVGVARQRKAEQRQLRIVQKGGEPLVKALKLEQDVDKVVKWELPNLQEGEQITDMTIDASGAGIDNDVAPLQKGEFVMQSPEWGNVVVRWFEKIDAGQRGIQLKQFRGFSGEHLVMNSAQKRDLEREAMSAIERGEHLQNREAQ